ncbi:MAG: hypothetical protein ACP5HU_09285 [Phycisphaerae bacterium]
MKRMLTALLISLSVLTTLAGGCIDIKVDRDAVQVGRFLGPSENDDARDATQLPATERGDEAI